MRVISAPLPWVEAQDQPCKGSKEIRKSATESLLTEFRPQNQPENQPLTPRSIPVIYFHINRSANTSPRLHTQKNTASITAYGKKNTCQKQPKRGPGQRHTRPARGSVSHELSTPQGERASLKPMPQKIFEILHGADDLCNKKTYKILQQIPTRIPRFRGYLRRVICFVCLFTTLPRTDVLNGSTNTRAVNCNTPTANL